jgi:hypothetical protein
MKTIEEFKSSHTELIAMGLKESGKSKPDKKDRQNEKRIRKLIPRIAEAIRLMEQGLTEDTLRSQIAGLVNKKRILDSRFIIPEGIEDGAMKMLRKEYEKKFKYAEMRRQGAFMKWMLNY